MPISDKFNIFKMYQQFDYCYKIFHGLVDFKNIKKMVKNKIMPQREGLYVQFWTLDIIKVSNNSRATAGYFINILQLLLNHATVNKYNSFSYIFAFVAFFLCFENTFYVYDVQTIESNVYGVHCTLYKNSQSKYFATYGFNSNSN